MNNIWNLLYFLKITRNLYQTLVKFWNIFMNCLPRLPWAHFQAPAPWCHSIYYSSSTYLPCNICVIQMLCMLSPLTSLKTFLEYFKLRHIRPQVLGEVFVWQIKWYITLVTVYLTLRCISPLTFHNISLTYLCYDTC